MKPLATQADVAAEGMSPDAIMYMPDIVLLRLLANSAPRLALVPCHVTNSSTREDKIGDQDMSQGVTGRPLRDNDHQNDRRGQT